MAQGVELIKAMQAAARLLEAPAWPETLPRVLGEIGEALQASCLHILQNNSHIAGPVVARSRWGWSAAGLESQPSGPEFIPLSYGDPGAGRWATVQQGGEAVCGPAEAFPGPERYLLVARQAHRLVLLPIFSGTTWWGSLWADRSASGPEWKPAEVDVLEFAVHVVEAALLRQEPQGPPASRELIQTEQALRRSNDRLALLHELDQAILGAELPDEIARATLERLGRILPCDRSSVIMFDADLTGAQILAAAGRPQGSLEGGRRVPIQEAGISENLQQGQVNLIEDLQAVKPLTPLQEQLRSFGIRSYLSVPLITQGDLVGALNLGAGEPGAFPPDALEVAREVADSLAVGVQNARLYQAEREARQTAEILRRANLALTQNLDLDAVLETLLDYLAELVSYDSANIMLIEGERVRLQALRGYERWMDPEQIRSLSLELDRTPTLQTILTTKKSLLVEDTAASPQWVSVPGTGFIRAWMGIPLIAGGQVIGFYSLDKSQAHFFTPAHLERAETLAAQAAVAIQNARLYQAERRRRNESESLRAALAGFTTATALDSVLEAILDRLEHVIPFESAGVFLTHEDALQVAAVRGTAQPQRWVGKELAGDHQLLEALGRERQAVWLEEASLREAPSVGLNAGSQHGPFEPWLGGQSVRGWMGIPLVVRDEFIGCLTLASARAGAFGPGEASLAQAFAGQAAVAIQNARLFEQVRAGRERLQALSQRLVEVQESERRSLARELHDQIGQLLTGLKLILEMSARAPASDVAQNLEEAKTLVNELMGRVRELSLDLRPAMLDDLGLLPALLWLFERYGSQTQVKVSFRHSGVEDRRFQPEVETTAYRIVQEALTNVARHAHVEQAWVRLRADDELLYLQVEDRGRGFDPEAVLDSAAQSGLSGMRERAMLARGQLVIESHPRQGTLVSAELPLHGYVERRGRQR